MPIHTFFVYDVSNSLNLVCPSHPMNSEIHAETTKQAEWTFFFLKLNKWMPWHQFWEHFFLGCSLSLINEFPAIFSWVEIVQVIFGCRAFYFIGCIYISIWRPCSQFTHGTDQEFFDLHSNQSSNGCHMATIWLTISPLKANMKRHLRHGNIRSEECFRILFPNTIASETGSSQCGNWSIRIAVSNGFFAIKVNKLLNFLYGNLNKMEMTQ